MKLRLISHNQCPFVQRALIVLGEKNVAHDVEYVDLRNKPAWFTALSPRGKVPLLVVDGVTLFESSAICEFLEETAPGIRLHPADPVERARHRAWIEFASGTLTDIAGLYAAHDEPLFALKRAGVERRFLGGGNQHRISRRGR